MGPQRHSVQEPSVRNHTQPLEQTVPDLPCYKSQLSHSLSLGTSPETLGCISLSEPKAVVTCYILPMSLCPVLVPRVCERARTLMVSLSVPCLLHGTQWMQRSGLCVVLAHEGI